MKTINLDNITYPIVETFHSVQGEGAWMGVNAFFIRLGGCDVGCPWCFASSTSILMADWTEKSIDTIQIGDEVMTLDMGGLAKTKVTAVHPPRTAKAIALEFSSGVVTCCTPEHQYKQLTGKNKLKAAQYIEEAYYLGENLQLLKPDTVVNRLVVEPTVVYNFATEHGYYFANKHLVKNCDTKQSWNPLRHPQRKVTELVEEAIAANPAIVIITGGEPLMHDLTPLTTPLQERGMRVHLETSGAHPFSGIFDWVTFSPKRFKSPHESIYEHVDELKVVVKDDSDLQWASQQGSLVSPKTLKYLQPEWNTPESKQLIFTYILKHPDWRISLQTHKFLGVR